MLFRPFYLFSISEAAGALNSVCLRAASFFLSDDNYFRLLWAAFSIIHAVRPKSVISPVLTYHTSSQSSSRLWYLLLIRHVFYVTISCYVSIVSAASVSFSLGISDICQTTAWASNFHQSVCSLVSLSPLLLLSLAAPTFFFFSLRQGVFIILHRDSR